MTTMLREWQVNIPTLGQIQSEIESLRALIESLGEGNGGSGNIDEDLRNLITQTAINLAKTNFKLNAHIAATRERLSGLIIDVFTDTSGIDKEFSRAWGYDPERKEIHTLTDLVWEERFTTNAPPARRYYSLAYDSARGVVVLFGGTTTGTYAGRLNDTWEYDGTDWRQINTPTKPAARYGHSLTYDSARGVVVLFGGYGSSSHLNDTWEYDGTNWRRINTPTSPPARQDHSLAYDSARGVVVLFGGSAGYALNDTWEYDGTDWRQINTPTKPAARYHPSLAYDSARGVVVLFGGTTTGNSSGVLDDTWEYNGDNWRRINTPTKPEARYSQSLTYDSARGVVVLFGGVSSSGGIFSDTWEYDGTDWRQSDTPAKPRARYGHSLTYDSTRGVVVLFGGYIGSNLNDTWEYYDNAKPAEVVSSADILDSRPSYIYFVSHTPEDVSDASIQYQMSLDDGETWFSVSPEELIQVKSNINSSDPPIIRAKAIIPAGSRLSGWAYGWV